MSIFGRFHLNQHRVLFTGTDDNDQITISRDSNGHLVGNGELIDDATVSNTDVIRVNGGDGNDIITLDEANGPLPAAELRGGDGNDTLTGGSADDQLFGQDGNDSLFGLAGADSLSGGDGNDFIAGGAGNDTLFGGDGNDFLDGDQGADVGFLGAGDDVFRWDPGDGSDIVEGDSGFDEMLFNGGNGAEQFALTANGDRALFTRVQGSIVMDMDNVEKVTVNTAGGADTVTINDPTGTDVTDVQINLGAGGVGDTDIININDDDDVSVVFGSPGEITILGVSGATVHITGFESQDHLFINGDLFI